MVGERSKLGDLEVRPHVVVPGGAEGQYGGQLATQKRQYGLLRSRKNVLWVVVVVVDAWMVVVWVVVFVVAWVVAGCVGCCCCCFMACQ